MWLKLTKGEMVSAELDISSIRMVNKHWMGDRSELCLGEGCPFCIAGIPRQRRYQATLVVDRKAVNWEFGALVMRRVSRIDHSLATMEVTITRRGEGKRTRYDVRRPGRARTEDTTGKEAPPVQSKYLGGKYGHMVRH